MKKKSNRDIPDFAPKRPHNQSLLKLRGPKAAPPPQPKQVIKPQATAAKGNRRGQ